MGRFRPTFAQLQGAMVRLWRRTQTCSANLPDEGGSGCWRSAKPAKHGISAAIAWFEGVSVKVEVSRKSIS